METAKILGIKPEVKNSPVCLEVVGQQASDRWDNGKRVDNVESIGQNLESSCEIDGKKIDCRASPVTGFTGVTKKKRRLVF